MKYKMLAMIMVLTVTSWAQTATQGTAPTPQQNPAPAAKAKCPCCDKMAAGEMKCAHHDMQAKNGKEIEAMPDGKKGMSCMRTKQDSTASCCGKDCENDKCGKASDSKDKTAHSCCGSRCSKDGKSCCASKAGEKTAANRCQRGLRG
jgi:hypothetical protein